MARPQGRHHGGDRRWAARALTWAAHARLGAMLLNTMKLLVTGVSHKTAPVEVRERLAFPEAALPDAAARPASRATASPRPSSSPPATASRSPSPPTTAPTRRPSWTRFLADIAQRRRPTPSSRTSTATRATTPSTTCSAWPPAWIPWWSASRRSSASSRPPTPPPRQSGALCGWLEGLLDARLQRRQARALGNRHRPDGGLGQLRRRRTGAQDLRLARQPHGHDRRARARCRELAARHLRRSGRLARLRHQPHPRARRRDGASCSRARRSNTTRFVAMLPEVDILIASTGAPHYILRKEEMQRVIAARRNRPMFLIDIAVPRNIEPGRQRPRQRLPLRHRRPAGSGQRQPARAHEGSRARRGRSSRRKWSAWWRGSSVQEVTPTIVGLQEQLEQIRAGGDRNACGASSAR